jgi:hypothetical protein
MSKPLAILCYLALSGHVALRTSKKPRSNRGEDGIIDFARQHGAAVNFVRIQNFNHGGTQVRGLEVIEDLPENTTVISVPPHGQFGRTSPTVSEFFGPWAPGDEEVSGWRLVCTLAVEHALGERSMWFPYIQHLPSLSDFRKGQLLWARSEVLHHFSALPAADKVSQLHTWLEGDIAAWDHWMSITSPDWQNGTDESAHVRDMRLMASNVSRADLEWAYSVVTTRALKKPGVGVTLVPLVDDINTDVASRRNAEWITTEDKFEVRTTRAVFAGEELLMRYTTELDNNQYAAEWGFLLEDVPAQPLSASTCSSILFRSENRSSLSSCAPPGAEAQPQIWCLLENLARESCEHEL